MINMKMLELDKVIKYYLFGLIISITKKKLYLKFRQIILFKLSSNAK